MSDGIDAESARRQALQRLQALKGAGLDRAPVRVGKSAKAAAPPARERAPAAAPAPPAAAPAKTREPGPTRTVAAATTSKARPAERAAPPVPAAETAAASSVPLDLKPALAAADRPGALAEVARDVAACVKCSVLAAGRTQTVFGAGDPNARLMFIGEAPGADEDRTGQPFVGRAGQLLTDMITKGMGLRREDVFIANILKCRPPENRNPLPAEVANCLPYLQRQIEIIRPEFLCLLGRIAVQALLETSTPMGKLRGRWHSYRGIRTIVTWHPAYLLRNPPAKKDTWEDLQMLMKEMGIAPPTANGRA